MKESGGITAKTKVPFALQIILILLFGVAASIAVLLIFGKGKNENIKHTVTFAYQDGTVIDKKEAKNGCGIFPPEFKTDGIFRGWSCAINDVTADIEAHPITYTPVEDNLFYFDSVYVKEGESFTLGLYVTGEVNFDSASLALGYDSEVMTYSGAQTSDVCEISPEENGTLGISVRSDTNITEKTWLADITFVSAKKDVYSTEIRLSSKGATFIDGGEIRSADSATINNNIYYLQEVSK